MFKKLKKQQEGFTIIEVMIVLVIAAVILLIVFLAVPALQRNSRNTQRKNDVAGLLSGVNEYISNSGGTMPPTGWAWLERGDSTGSFGNAVSNTKLGFYSPHNVFYGGSPTTVVHYTNPPSSTPSPDNTTLFLFVNATCNGTDASIKPQSRSIAVVYNVESGSGGQYVCQSE